MNENDEIDQDHDLKENAYMEEHGLDSWEQRPSEPPKAYNAFCVHRDMGLARSLAKTAEALNHPPGYKQTLWEWSTKYFWQSRCRAYDQHMERVAQLERENVIREMINRHARDAVKIQQMVMESLEKTPLESAPPRDLIRVWQQAVRAERASRGLPAESTKDNYVDYTNAATKHYRGDEKDRAKDEKLAMLNSMWSP